MKPDRTAAPKLSPGLPSETTGLAALAVISLVTGAASGLIGALFRVLLLRADRLRGDLIAKAHDWPIVGILSVIAAAAAATAVAAWLVRRFAPPATGSGIPNVEAILDQEQQPAPFILLPIKFIGGLLAIGAGLALGREGPTVQMGATVSHLLGKLFRRSPADARVLLAAGAGAGLATAFNAPIAGAIFVLEELVRRFDTRITIATFGASAGAIAISRMVLGDALDFNVGSLPYHGLQAAPAHLALGVVAGLCGVLYNRAILAGLDAADRLRRWPVELRAAIIGAAVGLTAWFAPQWVGGGDPITQHTLTTSPIFNILLLGFVLRFVLGAVSYAALTPGGLFAPMLVLGAQTGVLFAVGWFRLFPTAPSTSTALGVVGMAAVFTAVVRAPLTGIILVVEMTGSFALLLPMLVACFAAMLIPTLLRNPPIYDALRARSSPSSAKPRD